jgi:outer membrane protein OmpA-like peptidoglycan-associated protein
VNEPPAGSQGESLTRGFKPRANPDAATKVCDPELNLALLSKTGKKGEQLTRTLYIEDVPKVDLDIAFKRGEASLLPEGEKQLNALAVALNDKRLSGQSFVVAGHTDAEGSADYNDRLSCERALSARRYLKAKFGISEERLIPMGFGFTRLKDTADKLSQVNRRVEIRRYTDATN